MLLAIPIAVFVIAVREAGQLAAARLCRLPIARVRLGVRAEPAPPWRAAHLVPIAAATVATYLAIAVLAFGHAAIAGSPSGRTFLAVDAVLEGYDATGKLEPGDRIIAVDGDPIGVGARSSGASEAPAGTRVGSRPEPPPSLSERVSRRGGAPVALTIERAGQARDVTVTPKPGPQPGMWLLGIRPTLEVEHTRDVAASVRIGLAFPIDQVGALIAQLGSTGEADAGGPVRIVDEFRDAYRFDARRAVALILPYLVFGLLAAVAYDAMRAIALVLALRRQRTPATATR
jgi:hypothetical protein